MIMALESLNRLAKRNEARGMPRSRWCHSLLFDHYRDSSLFVVDGKYTVKSKNSCGILGSLVSVSVRESDQSSLLGQPQAKSSSTILNASSIKENSKAVL